MKGMQPGIAPPLLRNARWSSGCCGMGNLVPNSFSNNQSLLSSSRNALAGVQRCALHKRAKRSLRGAEHILADYLAMVNGEDVGVILFQREGRLSSLEVYSQAGTDKPFGLPDVDTIYSYEELPERQRKRDRIEG
jgi:hypothetical protein